MGKSGLALLITREEVADAVNRLAAELDKDYAGSSPVVVGILKGAFVFVADLIRQLDTPLHSIEFLRISNYGTSTVSTGQPKVFGGVDPSAIYSQHVIVVEDIVDTGITTAAALRHLASLQPTSLKLCALLDKPARRKVPVTIDYLGFTIPDRWIVGYGTDVEERYRQLSDVYAMEE